MGFWNNLFGGGGKSEATETSVGATEEYKGYRIRALVMRAGSEYQLAGEIEKTIDGAARVHKFIRADKFGSSADAQTSALGKGRQIIDEQGDRVFGPSWPEAS